MRALLVASLFGLAAPVLAGSLFPWRKTEKVDPKTRVPELIAVLRTEKDEGRRSAAAVELRNYDAAQFPDVVPALITALLTDTRPAVRIDAAQSLVAVLLKPFATAIDPPEQPLATALRERFPHVTYLELGPGANDAQLAAARAAVLAAPQLLVAMIVRPAAWHAFGLLAQQAEFVRSLTEERPTILASLGVPQALDDYPAAAARICTYSDVAVSPAALADVLLGR